MSCKLLKNKILKVCFFEGFRDRVWSDFDGRDQPAELDPEQGLDLTVNASGEMPERDS